MSADLHDLSEHREQWERKSRRVPAEQAAPLSHGGGDGTYYGMDGPNLDNRLSAVETAIDGLKHSQNMILAVLGIAFTVGIFGGGYLLTRVDALGTRVEALPGEISRDLQGITNTLSQSITAARAVTNQPQVIVIPERQVSDTPSERPPG